MPLTRVDGDFTQISNVIQVTIPEPPPPSGDVTILIGFMSGETWLANNDFSEWRQGGTVDNSIGYQNGYEVNADGTIIGSYGAYGEGSGAGTSRSDNFGSSYSHLGSPIYSNAPVRSSRVAFGGTDDATYFIHAGTRNTGQPSGAYNTAFDVDAFTWTAFSFASDLGTSRSAGIDAIPLTRTELVNKRFFVYTDDGNVYVGDQDGFDLAASGGPTQTFDSNNAIPYARFAGQGCSSGDTIVGMFCGRIVVSTDGGVTWDMSTYNDVFTETNIIGGAGFNAPRMFGLAYGGGVWVACGDADIGDSIFAPRIRISSVGAEDPWTDITVPDGIDALFDVIYDSNNTRFLMLGKSVLFGTSTFHVLESTDGGVTWTDVLQQEYGGPDEDKGWIKVFTHTLGPDTNFLLQEDGSRILQEDGSRIETETGQLFAVIDAANAPSDPYVGESPLFGLLHPIAFGGVVDVGANVGVSGLACFVHNGNEFTIGFSENGAAPPNPDFFETVVVTDRFGSTFRFNSADATATDIYNITFQPIGRYWTWPTANVLFEDGFRYTVFFSGAINP